MLSLAACGGSTGTTSGASTSAAAAASSTTNTKPSGAAFKIGGTAPLTGAAAIYGNAAKNGAEIAVEEINAEGGDIQFDLRYEDDVNDAEKAINAYNTLKDWGMQISLGSVTTKPCEATSTETYSDRIFALTPSASSKAVIEGKDNQYQMCFMDPNQGSASAQYISEKKLGTKIAIIWKNDDVYSKGIYQTFTEKAKELKLDIVSETTFADGNDTDFSVQITDAKDKGAAQLMGINVNATISTTFAIGSGLAAVAGVLLCSAYPTLVPTTGSMPGIKAFTAAVFGGIGSIPGALLGGLLMGIIEIFAKAYISTQLSDAVMFVVLIIVLLFKPAGLLGKEIREKV